MAIKNEIIDDLLMGRDPKTVFSSDGLLGELKKALADRILNAKDGRASVKTEAGRGYRGSKAR